MKTQTKQNFDLTYRHGYKIIIKLCINQGISVRPLLFYFSSGSLTLYLFLSKFPTNIQVFETRTRRIMNEMRIFRDILVSIVVDISNVLPWLSLGALPCDSDVMMLHVFSKL